ncbi:MAG TPA: hypothetical protein VKT73_04540 [Xanthobacteraceae bacterium]|nr:hypothetical protein [Xanthobacteraceae bacterium]
MLTNVALSQVDTPEEKQQLLVDLKCPIPGGGTLEFTNTNRAMTSYRVRVTYNKDQTPLVVTVDYSKQGEPFQPLRNINLRTETDSDARGYAGIFVNRAKELLERVCLGTNQNRSDYLGFLNTNRTKLGLPRL